MRCSVFIHVRFTTTTNLRMSIWKMFIANKRSSLSFNTESKPCAYAIDVINQSLISAPCPDKAARLYNIPGKIHSSIIWSFNCNVQALLRLLGNISKSKPNNESSMKPVKGADSLQSSGEHILAGMSLIPLLSIVTILLLFPSLHTFSVELLGFSLSKY